MDKILRLRLHTLIEPQNVIRRDEIDDARWCHPIDLMLQNMPNPLRVIRIFCFYFVRVIEPLHNLRDIEPRLHIKIRKRMRRIIKAAGILALEFIHHLLHNTARRKDLIRLLRRDRKL